MLLNTQKHASCVLSQMQQKLQYLEPENASCGSDFVLQRTFSQRRWHSLSEPRSAGCPHPTHRTGALTSASGWRCQVHLWQEAGTTTGTRCKERERGNVWMTLFLALQAFGFSIMPRICDSTGIDHSHPTPYSQCKSLDITTIVCSILRQCSIRHWISDSDKFTEV